MRFIWNGDHFKTLILISCHNNNYFFLLWFRQNYCIRTTTTTKKETLACKYFLFVLFGVASNANSWTPEIIYSIVYSEYSSDFVIFKQHNSQYTSIRVEMLFSYVFTSISDMSRTVTFVICFALFFTVWRQFYGMLVCSRIDNLIYCIFLFFFDKFSRVERL